MIDFHTHILPGIDDGSKNVHMSLAMLREEARQGIDTVLLTPHFYADQNSPMSFLRRRNNAWNELVQYLTDEEPDLYMGAEVQYFEGITSVDDIPELVISGTDLLLLEMPFSRWTERMVDDIFEMQAQWDVRVVLAHIERYMSFQKKDIWTVLRNEGILMQSNVSFFANRKTRRKAIHMLANGEIHFLGTDCHNKETRRPNWDELPPKAINVLPRNFGYCQLAEFGF